MTELLYLSDDALECTARVLSCAPLEDGTFAIVTDRTVLHVQGGGQPADHGFLGAIEVCGVRRTPDGIVHLTGSAITPGTELTIRTDAAARALHSRLHSAGHLIGYVVETLGWKALKGSHQPGQCRVVFAPAAQQVEPPAPELIQERIAELIAANLPLYTSCDSALRTVTWGTLPAYPCGGTHVSSTGLIGKVHIRAVRFKRGELTVSYDLV